MYRDEADAIVLGAGVAGLTAARAMREEHERVICIEQFGHVGGNHRSRNIGGYSFDIGSIIFNGDFPLFRYFAGVRELCVPFPQLCQRVAPDGKVSAYPFELKEAFGHNIFDFLLNGASLVAGRLTLRSPKNVEEFCIQAIGKRLYRSLGLKTYIDRFYGMPADRLDVRFAEQRMQFVTEAARFHRIFGTLAKVMRRRLAGLSDVDHRSFQGLVRPLSGFETMYGAVQADLAGRGVKFHFATTCRSISAADSGFVVETDAGLFRTKRVVSTIPVNDALKLLGHAQATGLQSSDLLTLYVSFDGKRSFPSAILYNFDGNGRWKRLTMHSEAYGRVNGREYFSVEFPFMKAEASDADGLYEGFVAHVRGNEIFNGDLRLEGFEITSNAYPAQTIGSDAILRQALEKIEASGIETVGRQGRFEYLPTIGHVMDQVERELAAGKLQRQA